MSTNPASLPHRRYNPLTGEWVQVSPQRTQRPWLGQVEKRPGESRPSYDPGCYLCPGNTRAGGERNPPYENTFVFTNDFSALMPDVSPGMQAPHPLLRSQVVQGTCRVVCFSPRHDLTLAEMDPDAIRQVVNTWAEQVVELGKRYRWVQVFENSYAVECNDDLRTRNWQLHQILTGDGSIMSCAIPMPTGTRRFFRISADEGL